MAAKFDFGVIGTSGLMQQGGRIDNELSQHLRGNRGPLLYREMSENDGVIGAILYLVKTFIKQSPWSVQPAIENDPESLDWAQFVESCRQDMSHTWSDFISEILSMVVYGWSYFEICYKRREGMTGDDTSNSKYSDSYIGWRKFGIRPQNTLYRWEFDQEMGIQGMWQAAPIGGGWTTASNNTPVKIPIDRSLLFRTEVTGNNPQGKSLLRNSVRPYLYCKRMQEIEAVGTERDLAGYPVFEVPLSLFNSGDPDNVAMVAQLQQALCDIRRDAREGAVIPCEIDSDDKHTGFKLRLMTSGGARALNLDTIIRRWESRMAMPLLAEFILLGTDKVGSFSMHASKQDVFATSLRAIQQSIADTINRYAVTRLCAINSCPAEKIPTLVPGDVAAPALSEMASFVQSMCNAGVVVPDAALDRWARQLAGMPEPDIESLPDGDAAPSGGMDETSQQTEGNEARAAEEAA